MLGEQRISQADLARMTEIRPSTINDWYNEIAVRINLEHLDRICEALQCKVSDLIEYIPNRIPQTSPLDEVQRQQRREHYEKPAE